MPDAQDYERLRDELIQGLRELVDPDTGRPVVRQVFRREEVYSGEHLAQAPDLVVLDEDAYHNRAGLGQQDVFASGWRWKGNNRYQGMFVLAGQGIRAGHRLEGATSWTWRPPTAPGRGAGSEDMDGQSMRPWSRTRPWQHGRCAGNPAGSQGAGETDEEYEESSGPGCETLGTCEPGGG